MLNSASSSKRNIPFQSKQREKGDRIVIKNKLVKFLPLLSLVLLSVFLQIVGKGKLFTAQSIEGLLGQAIALMIATTATIFVIATNNLDFSIGANIAFSSTVACLIGYSIPWMTPIIAIVVGLLIGLINGIVHVVFRLPSFIVTLCMMFILIAASESLTQGTNILVPMQLFKWNESAAKYILLIIYLLIIVVVFEYTRVGKQLKAIGVSEETAILSGVNSAKMRILSYVISGAGAGLAAFFMMLRTGSAGPKSGSTMTIDAIIAVVLGGMAISGGAKSTIWSGIVGASIITVLNAGIIVAGLGGNYQQLIKGIVFIIVVSMSTFREKGTIVQ
ncbi:MAG: ABC transporter permease [Fastidiosipila sp.]|nr:ABC transporter permease [Fastidiosipila sp.]